MFENLSDRPVAEVQKGSRCSVAVPHKVHRGDKVYKWEEV